MNEAERKQFAERVRRARREQFATVDAARQAAGIARGTWDKVEKGEPVKDFTIAAVERTLRLDAAWSDQFEVRPDDDTDLRLRALERRLALLEEWREEREAHDRSAAATKTPDPGPADQPGQDDYGLAARDVKDRRALEAGELETAAAGEPEPDDTDDMEPR